MSSNQKELHHRRSVRLQDYDYSQPGYYYVTICTKNGEWPFGNIIGDKMQLNATGGIAASVWNALPARFSRVKLEHYIFMPDHMHGIIVITQTPFVSFRANTVSHILGRFIPSDDPDPTIDHEKADIDDNERHGPVLGEIVRSFKATTTRLVHTSHNPGFVWQRGYYEHIIRNKNDLKRISQYILNNPARWVQDKNYNP